MGDTVTDVAAESKKRLEVEVRRIATVAGDSSNTAGENNLVRQRQIEAFREIASSANLYVSKAFIRRKKAPLNVPYPPYYQLLQ